MSDSSKPSGPPAGRIAKLKHDGAASAAELREFLESVKGKSPQEVMGAVATSSLVQSTIIAAGALCLILIGASVIAYALPTQDDGVATKKSVETDNSPNDGNRDAAEADSNAAGDTAAANEAADKALDHLGIRETKQTKPGEDPLNSLNDLLDGVK